MIKPPCCAQASSSRRRSPEHDARRELVGRRQQHRGCGGVVQLLDDQPFTVDRDGWSLDFPRL